MEQHMNTDDILKMAEWSEPKEVQTKYGPRILRKAAPTDEFSAAWKSNRMEIKNLGAGFGKDRSGNWELTWWQELSAEVKQERKEAIEASRATSAEIELPHPDFLDYFPFQKAGIKFGLGKKGILIADEMGLGKTIQAIGIFNASPEMKTAIVVCPKSLKLNWYREFTRWLTKPDISIGVADGSWPGTDIVILNYEALGKFQSQIAARTWDLCITDEAHYIKNYKTIRSKNVKSIKATKIIRMTGTPIVNRPAELYNIIEDLGGNWGSFFSFARRYCNAHQNSFGWDMSGASNLDELQRRLRETIMVRRLKSEVLTELPKKIRQIVEIEGDTREMKRAIQNEQSFESESEARIVDLRAAVELSKAEGEDAYRAAVSRLREAMSIDFEEISRVRHETALAKVPAVISHIQEVMEDNNGYKVVIAAHHHDVIAQLASGLDEFHPVVLTGETKEIDRQGAVDTFQDNPDCKVFIGSITAAGVGITLTASSHVIFAELDWVPGNITQMEDRCHRIGQTESVLVQHIVLQDSIDARMAHSLVEKQAVIDSALDVNHPERTRPVLPEPKNKAASAGTPPDKLTKIAEQLNPEKVKVIHSRLQRLAGNDMDHAAQKNDIGFNRIDGVVGHSLANAHSLSPRQAALGFLVVAKYWKQFGDAQPTRIEDL